MKKLLLFVCTFYCLLFNAQLDTEHWFAPMSSPSLQSTPECYLYLSTNETTPFQVQIYNGTTLFTTVPVSKGSPAQVTIPYAMMITQNLSTLFTPNNMGLHVKGSKKFFANFRFGVVNHAEILTSKGQAGLGKTFYAATVPNTYSAYYVNSTIGVTATEDNTTVTLSGYNPDVVFADGLIAPTRTFTLNRGQSYIIEARSDDGPFNLDGLTGAKIASDKAITVTNGNFTSIYTLFNSSNTDIVMDQAVPTERLGSNFVLAKGNGISTSGMEIALVIATEPNTTITVNGTLLPGVNLNPGQYYIVDGSYYINQGNDNFNMSIATSKNAYVYQLIGGTSTGQIYATGGMNFIPPLSCFLPNTIDEIGIVNKIGNTTYPTKLNIITQTGATVTLNGGAIAAGNGPYPVTGNPNWVTYSVPNVTGNITVNSTKSVTAGIAAGNSAVGYGGYFAGFSAVPAITKTGDCLNGILLQVDNTYDAYQWYLNGNPIPGANAYFINPELYGAGNYTCLITKNNCESKLTNPYSYTLCPPISTTTFNIGSCNTKTITPQFTNSTQTISIPSVNVVVPPTSGMVSINSATGQITYSPNVGLTTDITDTFIYYIEGNGNPADFEYFKVIINIDVLQVTNDLLTACVSTGNTGLFDLTTAAVTPDLGTTVTYFSDAALTQPIAAPNTYTSPSGNVYAQVTSAFGCSKTATIALTLNLAPNLNTANFNATFCDDDGDGIININFATVTPQIVNNSGSFTVRYYLNQADATAGNNNTLPANWTYTTNTTVYVRVDSNNNCPSVFGQLDFVIKSKIPLLANTTAAQLCDTDMTGSESVNLSNYSNLFTTDPSVNITYHTNLADAQTGANAITPLQTINTNTTGVYYLSFTNGTQCLTTASINITVNPAPNINTANFNANICDDNLDGIANVNFSAVTPQIVTNSGSFTVRYYLNQADATAGNNNTLPANWAYTANTTVYVRVDGTGNSNCSPAFGQIAFKIGIKIPLLTNSANTQVCDDDLSGSETVNLNDYKNQFTTDPSVTLTFHATLANAQAGTNPIAAQQIITATGTFFIRFTSNSACPNTATITITLKAGKKSDVLKDQIVCLDERTLLDAGLGFTSYLWSTGATTSSIMAGAGVYFVDLGFNGCIYRQTVTVTTAQSPIITSIQVTGSNATINVTGGTAPYQYSLNGIDYQTSNTFYGLPRGTYKVYVLGADGCQPITKEFLIINLVNAITPNGDGHNDALDYSELKLKQNVSIEVVDRYGAPVYKSSNNNYIWDGKMGGRNLSTGTYWFILKWTEPDTKLPVSHSGWLIIKNRD